MRSKNTLLVFAAIASLAASSASAVENARDALRGSVSLAPALKAKIGPDAVLYVIARKSAQGAPIAVKRVIQPFYFPIHFELGPEDSMMGPGTGAGTGDGMDGGLDAFSGKFSLSARISQNGSATAKAGDLQTSHPLEGAEPGIKKNLLTIDQIRPASQ